MLDSDKTPAHAASPKRLVFSALESGPEKALKRSFCHEATLGLAGDSGSELQAASCISAADVSLPHCRHQASPLPNTNTSQSKCLP